MKGFKKEFEMKDIYLSPKRMNEDLKKITYFSFNLNDGFFITIKVGTFIFLRRNLNHFAYIKKDINIIEEDMSKHVENIDVNPKDFDQEDLERISELIDYLNLIKN